VNGGSGAVAGFFTYYNDSTESDIEILTRDPGSSVHYSNQPTRDDSGATVLASTWNTSMPAGRRWTDWNIYRLDWLAGESAWYLNGKLAASTNVNVPRSPSVVILNMWSNEGTWAGGMAKGEVAELHIQWVEMVFNTSGDVGVSSASVPTTTKAVVCSVDELVGTPMVAQGAAKCSGNGQALLLLPLLLEAWLAFA
jgi:beta-glucanase (GH16 family)